MTKKKEIKVVPGQELTSSIMFNCSKDDHNKFYYIAKYLSKEGDMSSLLRQMIKDAIKKNEDKLPKKLN